MLTLCHCCQNKGVRGIHHDNQRDSQGAAPLHNIESLMCNGSITHRSQSLPHAGGLL